MFSKMTSPECIACKRSLGRLGDIIHDNMNVVELEKRQDLAQIDYYLWKLSGLPRREVPVIFVDGQYIGGYNLIIKTDIAGKLKEYFNKLLSKTEETEETEETGYKAPLRDVCARIRPIKKQHEAVSLKITRVEQKPAPERQPERVNLNEFEIFERKQEPLKPLAVRKKTKSVEFKKGVKPTRSRMFIVGDPERVVGRIEELSPQADSWKRDVQKWKTNSAGQEGLKLNYKREKMTSLEMTGSENPTEIPTEKPTENPENIEKRNVLGKKRSRYQIKISIKNDQKLAVVYR